MNSILECIDLNSDEDGSVFEEEGLSASALNLARRVRLDGRSLPGRSIERRKGSIPRRVKRRICNRSYHEKGIKDENQEAGDIEEEDEETEQEEDKDGQDGEQQDGEEDEDGEGLHNTQLH